MDYLVLPVCTFFIAILTFFSGFGLGTLLTPVLMIFFPVDSAIIMTGIIHFFNNLSKLAITGGRADKATIIQFGLPAMVAAMAGAWLMLQMPEESIVYQYKLGETKFEVSTLKFVLGLLMFLFALSDLLPSLKKIQFEKKHMVAGGILSGFFGGFSGHQGALRSAFLIKSGLSKEVFVGTTVVISTMVDFTRMGIYATQFQSLALQKNIVIILLCIIGGIFGSLTGNILLKKTTLSALQSMIGILLIVISILLSIGIL